MAHKKEAGREYSPNWGGLRAGSNAGKGRPATGRRYKTFSFSCSPEEYERIRADVAASGMKASRYFVKKLLEP